jgi:hypothetical protein
MAHRNKIGGMLEPATDLAAVQPSNAQHHIRLGLNNRLRVIGWDGIENVPKATGCVLVSAIRREAAHRHKSTWMLERASYLATVKPV